MLNSSQLPWCAEPVYPPIEDLFKSIYIAVRSFAISQAIGKLPVQLVRVVILGICFS